MSWLFWLLIIYLVLGVVITWLYWMDIPLEDFKGMSPWYVAFLLFFSVVLWPYAVWKSPPPL